MHLSEIYIYPIKSLPAIPLQKVETEIRGLKHDRRWMLIDDTNRFISQRQFPNLTLLTILLHDNEFTITHPDFGSVTIEHQENTGRKMTVEVWDDRLWALEVSHRANEWFSTYLNAAVRLVKVTDSTIRPIPPKYGISDTNFSFADGSPYLLTSTASLQTLEQLVQHPLEMLRFRPNLVIDGFQVPYEEDNLIDFQIGECVFKTFKPCGRCVMVNIDPNTALSTKEPLATLSKTRRYVNKVLFGMYVVCMKQGTLNVGDKLITI